MLLRGIARIALVILILSTVLLPGDSPYPANSVDGISQRYLFSIAGWELRHLLSGNNTPSKQDTIQVLKFFGLATAAQGPSADRDQLKPVVQDILKQQLAQVLRDQGLTTSFGPFSALLFPPLRFELTELPFVLAVSPREKIELLQTVLLDPSLSEEETAKIEADVEKLGLSAVVERTGGVAVYPSAIPEGQPLQSTLSAIAHEWFHQYLFFRPLGRAYWSNYEMRTINETVADMAGQEAGRLVYERYYGDLTESRKSGTQTAGVPSFDFNKEMRGTRATVDFYLEHGMVAEAERYLEERRLFFIRNGYYIRRLNQAYFAFHGSYGDDPASVSPVSQQLAELRRQSGSLGEFVKLVSQVSNSEELNRLVPPQ
ncbi:MAG: hypothetical protein AB1603_01140 [Chloroflexota bacterium]